MVDDDKLSLESPSDEAGLPVERSVSSGDDDDDSLLMVEIPLYDEEQGRPMDSGEGVPQMDPIHDEMKFSSGKSKSSFFSEDEDSKGYGQALVDKISRLCKEQEGDHDSDDEVMNRECKHRIEDFCLARLEQEKSYRVPAGCFGIFGLAQRLSDVRDAMEWAQEAARRRSDSHPPLSWSEFQEKMSVRRPWFCYTIIVASTATLVCGFAMNDWAMEDLKVNPMIGPSSQVLLKMGARSSLRIVQDKEWYRLVTPMVLHAGLIHYAANCLLIGWLGTIVEQAHGSWMTAATFVMSTLGGNVAGAIYLPKALSVGASGGVFSLYGICVADLLCNWDVLITMPSSQGHDRVNMFGMIFFVCLQIGLELLIGLTPFVDNFAHLGGFVYGICFGFVFCRRLSSSGFFGTVTKKTRAGTCCLKSVALKLAVTLLASTVGVLYQSDPETGPSLCSGCQYISCVPFPFWIDDKWWECETSNTPCSTVKGNLIEMHDGSFFLEMKCPNGGDFLHVDMEAMSRPGMPHLRSQMVGLCNEWC